MAELKAGGLALVIFSENQNEIGRCVELIEAVARGHSFNFPTAGKHSWGSDVPAWLVKGDVSLYTDRQSGGFSYFLGTELMPIDGDESPDTLRYTKEISNA